MRSIVRTATADLLPALALVSLFGLASTLLVTGAGPYSIGGWASGSRRAERPPIEVEGRYQGLRLRSSPIVIVAPAECHAQRHS